jgi:aquaporin Z
MRGLNFLAEFFGTFLLLMSILTTGNFAIIGLTLAATIFLVGNVSGANLNPAVSLAMYLSGKLDIVRFLGYSLAQMLGGAAAFYSYTYVKGLRASK